jgi:hypothetical protein
MGEQADWEIYRRYGVDIRDDGKPRENYTTYRKRIRAEKRKADEE